jgi:hypothetical protein
LADQKDKSAAWSAALAARGEGRVKGSALAHDGARRFFSCVVERAAGFPAALAAAAAAMEAEMGKNASPPVGDGDLLFKNVGGKLLVSAGGGGVCVHVTVITVSDAQRDSSVSEAKWLDAVCPPRSRSSMEEQQQQEEEGHEEEDAAGAANPRSTASRGERRCGECRWPLANPDDARAAVEQVLAASHAFLVSVGEACADDSSDDDSNCSGSVFEFDSD